MINEQGFGIAIAVDGQELQEFSSNGQTYVAGIPGKNYTIRMFVPKGPAYGAILTVDELAAYADGKERNRARGINQATDDRTENELPGPFFDTVEGLFTFTTAEQSDGGHGVIQISFFDNSYAQRLRSGGWGCGDLKTIISEGKATVALDYNAKYKPGQLIHTMRIHYATAEHLRRHGISN
jgi:hypothetical protein